MTLVYMDNTWCGKRCSSLITTHHLYKLIISSYAQLHFSTVLSLGLKNNNLNFVFFLFK